jgi:hypothetical protein
MTEQQENEGNGIINSLKRLERAGSENSRTTQKLKEATYKVADEIALRVAKAGSSDGQSYLYSDLYDELLPRDYFVTSSNGSSFRPELCYCKDRRKFAVVRYSKRGEPSREQIQGFAKDIATGLLDEIATFLEQRAQENEQAATTLNNA